MSPKAGRSPAGSVQLTRRELSDGRGRELFDLPAAPRPAGATAAPVRYLPEYDNLLLAHDDRSRIFAPEHRPRVTLKNLQVRATFFVDGFVAGTWRVESKKPAATLVVEPFKVLKREAKRREFRVDPAAHSID